MLIISSMPNAVHFGANVDDSVMCQVYNNIGESDVAIEAVNATKGLCLTYNNVVISARLLDIFCGYTAIQVNLGRYTKNAFPSTTLEYLKSKKQHMVKIMEILTKDEKTLREFIKDTNIKC